MILALIATFAVACGGDDDVGEAREATLVLDFVAGAPHLGIFTALERGYYEQEGIDLEVVEPSSTSDTLRLIEAGRAEFGIADGIDVANQIDSGWSAKGIMAVAQRPLGGIITLRESGYESPADLEGGLVGITGVPSDEALVDTAVGSAGGDPESVERVTIGFGGVRALQSGSVDGFTGFIPADGVQVEMSRMPTHSFAFDEWGGPSYPGLVVFSTEERIEADPELMRSFVAATVRGYEAALEEPEAALDDLVAANPGLEPEFAEASTEAIGPFFTADEAPFGTLSADQITAMSEFLVEEGLIAEPIPPERYATTRFLP